MKIWQRHRVNYVFIFEFNPRQHNGPAVMFLGLLLLCFEKRKKYFNFACFCSFFCSAASLMTLLWTFILLLWAVASNQPEGFEWMVSISFFYVFENMF